MTRRSFLGAGCSVCAATPLVGAAPGDKRIPIAVELYSVRKEFQRDFRSTLRAVAKMGFEGVEFSGKYFDYALSEAKQVRRLLDELNLPCVGTHNSADYFTPEKFPRAIDLNQALGSSRMIQSSAPDATTVKGWHEVAERLNAVAGRLRPLGMRVGYHNHDVEFRAVDGKVPFEIIGDGTGPDVVLQLDIGFAAKSGVDPVALMERYPGRFATVHVKDYDTSGGRGFDVVFGEGAVRWKDVLDAAERVGGIECYIIEQDAGRLSPMETVERCLRNMRTLRR